MPHFAYHARDAQGVKIEGRIESPSAAVVADHLIGLGAIPIHIDPSAPPSESLSVQVEQRLRKRAITPLDTMMFSRQMYTLLKAGVPILRALSGLQESATNPSFAKVLGDLHESLDAGRELSQAFAKQPKIFDPFYVTMVRVGEETGRLEEIFLRLYHHLDFQKIMRDQVKSALRYPLSVMAAMSVAIVVINIFVIPAFAKVFKNLNAELPLMTRILIGFSDFMVAWWPALAGLLVATVVMVKVALRLPAHRYTWDRMKLKLPIAGKIMRKATLARFARSFALAQKSGVPIVQGLALTAQVVENSYIGRKLETMRASVERGESILRTATATQIFTPMVLQMIMVGEESGTLDELMQEVADHYQRDVEYELKTLSSQIEPILIVFLGVLVLILALGVFLPMWDFGKAAIK